MNPPKRYRPDTGFERRAWRPDNYLLDHPRLEWNPYTKQRPCRDFDSTQLILVQMSVMDHSCEIIKRIMCAAQE
jgi:hypothetical protein